MTHDRDRFSLIGHAALPFMSPLTEDELTRLLEPAALAPGDRALDIGGGRGDLSALLAGRFGCRALSIDRSPAACDQARVRTLGLGVTIECVEGLAHVRAARSGELALACAVGAIHAFGAGAASWAQAELELGRIAPRVLLADLVALGPHAAEAFEVAPLEALDLAPRSLAHVVLSPARVREYERTWADGLAAHLMAHPSDPRAEWARSRIAWTDEPSLRVARSELAFAAFLI